MNLESGVLQVHVEDIIPNRFQPRLAFDEQGLKELADSIREHGIIQPLVLRKLGDKFEIIAGERRYKAAQIAGLTTVPAVIANIDDNKSAEVALVENIQRRDLTAIEEARSYKNLLDKGYLTQEQLAKRMGLSQPAIANKLRLLNLDEEVQQALLEEKISERHARTLLTLTDKEAQKEWLHRIINERLTVRQLDLELKKLKEESQFLNSNEDEDNEGGIPLVNPIPSIDDIRANSIDIREANKYPQPEFITQPAPEDRLETLDIETGASTTNLDDAISKMPTFDPETGSINFVDNSYTPATSVPDFNITTPNSISNFMPQDNFINNPMDNKYFNFDNSMNTYNEPNYNDFISAPVQNENNFEVFDDPTSDNPFTTFDTPQINETTVPSYEAPLPSYEEPTNTFTNPEVNNSYLDLSPSNKFLTPVSEMPKDIELINNKPEDVDPMDAVNKIDTTQTVEQSGTEMKDAITTIRKCIEGLGDKGFYIDVEEIDFDSNYQITMRIHKDD